MEKQEYINLKELIINNAPYYKGKNFKINSIEIDINYFYILKDLELTLNKLGYYWNSEHQLFKKRY